jgi:hypothetical protein
MESDGKNAAQNICARLNMHDVRLCCPRPKSGNFSAFPNHDGQVLVPDHFPIRLLGFVEKSAFYCEAFLPKNCLSQSPNNDGSG